MGEAVKATRTPRRGPTNPVAKKTLGPDRRVLIVEDDPDLQKILELVLRSWGCEPLIAKDGQEGLRMALHEHPGLILLDVELPLVGGLDILGGIRDRGIDVPVVVMSGDSRPELAAQAAVAGANAFVPKPFSTAGLMATIGTIVADFDPPRPSYPKGSE